ncbi:cytochrome c oxidase assembly protein [Rhodococcus hoagii]|nr:cytochrome c oxidase assembly protein [Prescottella equi]
MTSIPQAPPSLSTLLTWAPQPVPVLPMIGILLALWYCWAVRQMRVRGRAWSWTRTASFLAGCVLLVAVTGLGVEGYGYRLFSVWMFQHLTLSMAIPPLLVLGAPGTLLMRTTPHRGIGRRIRRAALAGLRSHSARILLSPGVTIPLFLFSYYGIYLSPVFDAVAGTWLGHTGLEVFFLVTGILFILPVLSLDPLPSKQSNLGKFFDLFLEMPLHVFFGVILMMATAPLVSTFAEPPPAWGSDPMKDQQWAGALAWSYGEPVALVIVVVFAIRWNRDENRSARIRETRAEREGNHELDAYNAYLKSLPKHGPPTKRPPVVR